MENAREIEGTKRKKGKREKIEKKAGFSALEKQVIPRYFLGLFLPEFCLGKYFKEIARGGIVQSDRISSCLSRVVFVRCPKTEEAPSKVRPSVRFLLCLREFHSSEARGEISLGISTQARTLTRTQETGGRGRRGRGKSRQPGEREGRKAGKAGRGRAGEMGRRRGSRGKKENSQSSRKEVLLFFFFFRLVVLSDSSFSFFLFPLSPLVFSAFSFFFKQTLTLCVCLA